MRRGRVRDFVCPVEELVGAVVPLQEEEDSGLEYIDEPGQVPANPPPPVIPSPATQGSIPRTLPPEIDILTSSRDLTLPIILVSSKEAFNQAFSIPQLPAPKIGLGDEHAYVFWGFFKFKGDADSDGLSSRRVVAAWDVLVDRGQRQAGGRVEWAFELEWVPGWDGNDAVMRPWWAAAVGEHNHEYEDAQARARNLRWLNLNLVPAQLVDGQEEGSADEAMPRGWLCRKCGRLNQKAMMRHRWCGGVALGCRLSFCFSLLGWADGG